MQIKIHCWCHPHYPKYSWKLNKMQILDWHNDMVYLRYGCKDDCYASMKFITHQIVVWLISSMNATAYAHYIDMVALHCGCEYEYSEFPFQKLFIAHIDMVSLQYGCNGDCLATVSLSEPVLPFLFQWKSIIFRFFLCRTAVCIPILHWSLWNVNLILMVSTCMHTCLSHFFFFSEWLYWGCGASAKGMLLPIC